LVNKYAHFLQSETFTTASYATKYVDELSEHLSAEYEGIVSEVRERLEEIGSLPTVYHEVVATARTALRAYSDLLDTIAEREGFVE
jgi:hypothetical protein